MEAENSSGTAVASGGTGWQGLRKPAEMRVATEVARVARRLGNPQKCVAQRWQIYPTLLRKGFASRRAPCGASACSPVKSGERV